jgi:methylamine---glutamate N-methyltransferase subunit B
VATVTADIDCSPLSTREINRAIRRAAADGLPEVRLTNPGARHSLAVAVMQPVAIAFEGSVGWYCGGMCDGPDITVTGNCGWSVGENLMSGSITVHGNAGNSAAATIRGGRIVIHGDTGARAGIAMKGGTLIVGGSVGYMSGFMMQRGTVIVCGNTGDGIGDSMYEGTVFVGGSIHSLGADCIEAEISDDDRSLLESELAPLQLGPAGDWKKLVAGRRLWNFSKHEYDAWRAAL